MSWFTRKKLRAVIKAPVSGSLIPISHVHDEAFSAGALGPGFAVKPSSNIIVAPCDGEIVMLFPTLHAFGIRADSGDEVLVHIGIDTVSLKGKPFKQLVNTKTVKAGTPMIKVDFSMLKDLNYDSTVVTVITQTNKAWQFRDGVSVQAGKDIVAEEQ